jgi:hypothetical protein
MTASRALGAVVLGAGALVARVLAGAPAPPIALSHLRLELPGVPLALLSVDLDRDGRRDLAVVVASTTWGEIGIDEPLRVDESGAFVDVLTVVPTVLDRRELLVFAGAATGGFTSAPRRLELPPSVHAIEAGPIVAPLLAWTDDGVAEVVAGAGGTLALLPRIATPTLFAGSLSFVPKSGLAADLDGDGESDVLIPTAAGLAVHLAGAGGIGAEPASIVEPPLEERLPGDARHYRRGPVHQLPLPERIDLDGDRLPDLVFRNHERRWNEIRACRNLGGGRFAAAYDPLAGRARDAEPGVVWLGDLDGDHRAELVTAEEIESEKETLRAELAQAKRPRFKLRVHAIDGRGVWVETPRAELEVEGYVFEAGDEDEFPLPAGVQDLDGDGRRELIAIRLDFSVLQALRVVAAKSIRLGLDFAIYRQEEGFRFRSVAGLDLAGDLRLRLDRLSMGQLSSFAGDFDGDGRADFLQLGRGRAVAIHRGREGARYSARAEATVELECEPLDVALVRVADFDGDGRSDLAVIEPSGASEIGARAALELHLSGAAR